MEQFRGLEGADKLIAQLRSLGALKDGLVQAARAAIAVPAQKAKNLAPIGSRPHRTYKGRRVNPGFLSKNIRTIVIVSRDGQSVRAALGVRKEAFYGVQFVERRLGKSSEKGMPFITPAFESTAQTMIEVVVSNFNSVIAKKVGGAR